MAVGLLAALVLGALVLATPLAGSQLVFPVRAEVPVDRDSWYWEQNRRVLVNTGAGFAQQQEAFPVASQKDHLQVALNDGEEDKRTFVGFDFAGLEDFEGSTVRSFTLVAEVSQANPEHSAEHQEQAQESQTSPVAPATSNAEAATIVACPLTSFMAGGADGDAPVSEKDPTTDEDDTKAEPDYDCEDLPTVEGERSSDGSTWTFGLGAIGAHWATADEADTAIVLKPGPEPPQPPSPDANWTVEFHGRALDGLTAQIVYTPPAPEGPAPTPEPAPEPAPQVEAEPAPAAPTSGRTSVTTSTPAPTPRSTPTPEPDTDGGVVAQPPSRQVSQTDVDLPWYAIVPWPLGLLALGLAYVSLRDEEAFGAPHRVASLLRARRAGGTEPPAPTVE